MKRLVLEAFLHEYRVTYPVAVDVAVAGIPVPATMRRYGMRGTPTLILINRAGNLRLHEFGCMGDLRLGMMLGQLHAE